MGQGRVGGATKTNSVFNFTTKVASSAVDPEKRKRKMAELLEQRLEDSDDGSSGSETEEEEELHSSSWTRERRTRSGWERSWQIIDWI